MDILDRHWQVCPLADKWEELIYCNTISSKWIVSYEQYLKFICENIRPIYQYCNILYIDIEISGLSDSIIRYHVHIFKK